MFKGFYNLTSGMLTQQRNLNVIANNMVNVSTPGYKSDRYTASTFDDVMYSLVGNKDKDYQELGRQSYILASSQIYTDYQQGIPEPTDLPLDFAIDGEGFFAFQMENGQTAYSRAGNFSLDNERYLCLPTGGRVLDVSGQPVNLYTDKVTADRQGRIYDREGRFLAQLGVYSFPDNGQLTRDQRGMFTGDGAQLNPQAGILHGYVERSNVDMVKQMTEMLTSQRALQSAAQMSKMYDALMNKATSEIGRL